MSAYLELCRPVQSNTTQYHISKQCVQWQTCWYMGTHRQRDNGHDESNRRFLRLCECAQKPDSICSLYSHKYGTWPQDKQNHTCYISVCTLTKIPCFYKEFKQFTGHQNSMHKKLPRLNTETTFMTIYLQTCY